MSAVRKIGKGWYETKCALCGEPILHQVGEIDIVPAGVWSKGLVEYCHQCWKNLGQGLMRPPEDD